jgi:hypothetical protein
MVQAHLLGEGLGKNSKATLLKIKNMARAFILIRILEKYTSNFGIMELKLVKKI